MPKGVKADPAKVKAIVDMPLPHDVTSVQRLLGFVNYLITYRGFCPGCHIFASHYVV